MLSVKNLVKVYKTKGGAPVRALDGVSVDFPEKGMVFLLGKSGSGKSTLLNMAGGLDEPDSGEIIIKGKSSKDFTKTDFDSYRNTYIGFIFQEYNILNEFNVEQNIALALQLQGKKNDRKAVNDILEQVDLKGLGKRKPNTLSGGQKQRIAIARALIKEPEIIMADEPTGALDSRTGKQVLETLKKLSDKKLVIIVSHDREFAEYYGDRIIELQDGKILSDVSKGYLEPTVIDGNVKFIGDGTVKIEDVNRLSETDVRNILYKIKQSGKEGVITFAEKDVTAVKRALKISNDGRKETFNNTDVEKARKDAAAIVDKKPNFIKSHLPLNRAIKIGLSGLRTKPIRLLFTIFLSVVAFTLFGAVATMMNFDAAYSVSKAMEGSPYDNVQLTKNYTVERREYSKVDGGEWELQYSYPQTNTTLFNDKDVSALNDNDNGLKFIGVYNYAGDGGLEGYYTTAAEYSISNSYGTITSNDFYSDGRIYGFADVKKFCENGEFTIVGAYPNADDEIAVSDYVYQSFKAYGFRSVDENGQSSGEPLQIENERELIGKQIYLRREYGNGRLYTITGVVKINGALYNDSRFIEVKSSADNAEKQNEANNNDRDYNAKVRSLEDYLKGSLHTVFFVNDEFYEVNKSIFNKNDSTNKWYFEWAPGKVINQNGEVVFDDGFNYMNENVVNDNLSSLRFYTFNEETFKIEEVRDYDLSKRGGKYGTYLPLNSYGELDVRIKFEELTNRYYSKEIARLESEINKLDGEIESNNTISDLEAQKAQLMEKRDKLILDQEECSQTSEDDIAKKFEYFKKAYDDSKDKSDWENSKDKSDWENVIGTSKSIKVMNDKNAEYTLDVRGFYSVTDKNGGCLLLSTDMIKEYGFTPKYETEWRTEYETSYVFPKDGKYSSVIALSDNSIDQIKYMVHFGDGTYHIKMTNEIYVSVDMMADMVSELKTIFLVIAVILGVFSALMLFNFISASISAKSKEIGILRAVGARGTDVFKIFFSEGGFVSFICFVLSVIATGVVCNLLNGSISEAINIKILNFGVIEITMILIVAVTVSIIATLIPVALAAKKPPVESIRAL